MMRGKTLILGFVAFLFTAVVIAYIVYVILWDPYGVRHAFDTPEALNDPHIIDIAGHVEVRFPVIVPFLEYQDTAQRPTRYGIGYILHLTINHGSVSFDDPQTLRVQEELQPGVTQTMFFWSSQPFETDGTEVVVQITDTQPAEAVRQRDQNDDWYWYREFYDVKIINM